MAETESTLSPDHRNYLTRRSALAGTAAIGALALPAGAAVAATSDADPGLTAIEAGYARWQSFRPLLDALWDAEEEGDPEADRIEAEWMTRNDRDRDRLYEERGEVRDEVLAIPTTSPRGVLIKLAMAVEAQTLDGIEAACGQCDFNAEDLLPAIVADIRTMAGRAVA